MSEQNTMFYSKLKTYKAKDLHPDCEVIKKKKFEMAVKEINNILFEYEYYLKNIQRDVRLALECLYKKYNRSDK